MDRTSLLTSPIVITHALCATDILSVALVYAKSPKKSRVIFMSFIQKHYFTAFLKTLLFSFIYTYFKSFSSSQSLIFLCNMHKNRPIFSTSKQFIQKDIIPHLFPVRFDVQFFKYNLRIYISIAAATILSIVIM